MTDEAKNTCVPTATAAILTLVLLPTALSACGEADKTDPVLVATTGPVANLVSNVSGKRFEVKQLVPAASDAHEFEPRARDAASLENARIVFASSANLDRWVQELITSSGSGAKQVDLFRALPHKLTDDSGASDPHWWHDPRNAAAAVDSIAAALGKELPGSVSYFQRNVRDFKARVAALDRRIERCLASIPHSRRKLVTNHDSLAYFARRYGIEVIGVLIPSLSTEAQPSAGRTRDLVELIERERVPAVFAESGVNPKLAQAVARETGARVVSSLYVDSLGPKGSEGATYLGMLRHNAEKIVEGLSGRRRASSCFS